MRQIIIFFLVGVILLSSGISFSEQPKVLDELLNKRIHPKDYIKSSDYVLTREYIREEVIAKLSEIIKIGQCDDLLFLLFFIEDISDPRYIGLLKNVENMLGSCAGVNIIGYSKFVEMKNSKARSEEMINSLAKPDMGSYLFDSVSSYMLLESTQFTEKLMNFRILCQKTDFKYMYEISDILNRLCSEDSKRTNEFLNANPKLKKKLIYDCNNLKQAP